MKVVLASKNPHKLVEIDAITRKLGIELILQSELGVDIDVEETGTTIEENSFLKANAVMQATGLPAMADDSGIVVDALNGEPGVYSARYGGAPSMTDHDRKMLLRKNMEHVPDGRVIQARGEIHGELTREPRGENGFGYDPIFYYPPAGMTTAEMPSEEKNAVSHRGNALKVLYEKLKEAGYADK